jgi:hypothetical protein
MQPLPGLKLMLPLLPRQLILPILRGLSLHLLLSLRTRIKIWRLGSACLSFEEHYKGCPPEDYLRLASSYLFGKPRSFYQSKYDAFKASGAVMADPRPFLRDTMLSGYGLKEESQTF